MDSDLFFQIQKLNQFLDICMCTLYNFWFLDIPKSFWILDILYLIYVKYPKIKLWISKKKIMNQIWIAKDVYYFVYL